MCHHCLKVSRQVVTYTQPYYTTTYVYFISTLLFFSCTLLWPASLHCKHVFSINSSDLSCLRSLRYI